MQSHVGGAAEASPGRCVDEKEDSEREDGDSGGRGPMPPCWAGAQGRGSEQELRAGAPGQDHPPGKELRAGDSGQELRAGVPSLVQCRKTSPHGPRPMRMPRPDPALASCGLIPGTGLRAGLTPADLVVRRHNTRNHTQLRFFLLGYAFLQ